MKTYQFDAIVVGTGAAGFNAANRLKQFGVNVAMVTEGVACGTSRNTGSDKQTYYKLGLGGDFPDSVGKMAENLFAGGAVDGDNALCEAALSVRCFLNLCELGVPFPVNRYGEYVGYKTDHDPYARATSAGPLTSKFMTEALEKKATALAIPVFDNLLAVEVLKKENAVAGLLCLEQSSGEFVAFHSSNIVLCTGGPAGVYADSVYPQCHTGTTSLALLAGAKAQNLTEWQYGLASVNPRWNVSGTYMQVLPRFVSVDEQGKEHEFLRDYFSDIYEALSMVFLKGYQWPFDSKKVLAGSSVIDLLVYRECTFKKRKVYLDYTRNPFDLAQIEYEKLSSEAYNYLHSAGACFGTPIERLKHMNMPAVDLYASKGLDICAEYLEIALCAQHNNGGIAVDLWWQTNVEGLFAAGECAGTHGIARPGGSALNAGQVGSLRAAQYISAYPRQMLEESEFAAIAVQAEAKHKAMLQKITATESNAAQLIEQARRRMSDNASAIRVAERMQETKQVTEKLLQNLENTVTIQNASEAFLFYKFRDVLVVQTALLCSFLDYQAQVGITRGSSLYYDKAGQLRAGLDESFRFSGRDSVAEAKVQEISFTEKGLACSWRAVRELPKNGEVFETIWTNYRKNKNIF